MVLSVRLLTLAAFFFVLLTANSAPTDSPTQSPSRSPSNAPSKTPTNSPTMSPSRAPSNNPSRTPTNSPTWSPSESPSGSPTRTPTAAPSNAPSQSPSTSPSKTPTGSPTAAPSFAPSRVPTNSPSASPTHAPSNSSSFSPTDAPSTSPSAAPTQAPTIAPSAAPSSNPTQSPTRVPTNAPSDAPSNNPTGSPSQSPTLPPTNSPTDYPSEFPSQTPSEDPSQSPTANPSASPSEYPTSYPSVNPSDYPTMFPTKSPTVKEECPEGEPEPFGFESTAFSDIKVGLFIYCSTERIEIRLECNTDEWCGLVFGEEMVEHDALVYTSGLDGDLFAALYAYRLTDRNASGVIRNRDKDWTLEEFTSNSEGTSMIYSQDLQKTEWNIGTEKITFRVALGFGLILNDHEQVSELITYNLTGNDLSSKAGDDSLSSFELIAVIAIPCLVLFTAINLGGYYYWNRRKKRESQRREAYLNESAVQTMRNKRDFEGGGRLANEHEMEATGPGLNGASDEIMDEQDQNEEHRVDEPTDMGAMSSDEEESIAAINNGDTVTEEHTQRDEGEMHDDHDDIASTNEHFV